MYLKYIYNNLMSVLMISMQRHSKAFNIGGADIVTSN